MDDKEIIDLLCSRNENGLSEIAERFGRLLLGVANGILGDTSDAEECVNDTYLKIWNSIPPCMPENLSAYAVSLVRHAAIDRYRASQAQKRNSSYVTALDELNDCLSDDSAEDNIDAKKLTCDMNDFIRRLDVKSRVFFLRRYYMSESITDIARRFSLRENTVSARLYRIRIKLHHYLKERGYTI